MGYAIAHGYCIACDKLFSFNPLRVPSSSAITGEREPICRPCIERVNKKRIELGLEPAVVFDDAYEPIDERELGE